MNCDRVRDRILTDYIDGECGEKTRLEIERHISSCVSCGELYSLIQEKIKKPFASVSPEEPPLKVWEEIQARIQPERQHVKEQALAGFFEKLTVIFAFRRPIAVLAGIMLVFALGVGYFQAYDYNAAKEYLAEEMDTLSSVRADNGSSEGFGTSIEEYLLQ
ncbi:MAG: zf-HC2 domain-containing protein [Candidatus Omnitrophica bacterium]|nr:zf-HC2 domain-containing protein [Candidatus Omnitrophota bacterium]